MRCLSPAGVFLLASVLIQGARAEYVYPRLFVGGVSGIAALQYATNSDQYRAAGGGVYLHHSGWSPLSSSVKDAIQTTFSGQDFAVEIGYNATTPSAWVSTYLANYHNRGIRPAFITCNAFASNNMPTTNQWAAWVAAFRTAGVDTRTLVLPTFEYANYQTGANLLSNRVSLNPVFQALVRTSGGLVLDTPSNYFFLREAAYRTWVVDAIQWTRAQGLSAVVILSPHTAGGQYDEQTALYVSYLKTNNALPNMYSVENYSTADPATYPNIVGSEDVAQHQLGTARLLQTQWLPNAVGRTNDFDGDGKVASAESALGRSDTDVRDLAFDFTTAGDFEGWNNSSNISGLTVAGGSLNGTATTSDPNLWKNTLFFDGGHIRNILIHMTAARAGGVQVYWGTNGTGFTGGQVVAASYTTSNTWQVVTVPMYVHPAWSNDSISSLRIDPISAANTAFQIDWIVGSDGDYDHDSLTDAEEGFGDTNGDGVPDAFDEDSDGDGRGDRQETVAGKDPYYAADGECAFISLGDAQGWIPANCANFRVTNGFLSATSSSNDPMLSRGGYYFAGADVKKIQVYLRSSAVASVQLFWGIQGNDVFSGSRVKTVAYTTTNAWQLVTFDMTGNTNWVGQVIQSLRLDPVNVNAALFDIDYIRAQP